MGGVAINRLAHGNECIEVRSVEYTHSARVLASLDRFVLKNSAIEVDLTGQVNAEVAAGLYVGAVGGSLDFTRGAQYAERGLPIIALPSRVEGMGFRVSRNCVVMKTIALTFATYESTS